MWGGKRESAACGKGRRQPAAGAERKACCRRLGRPGRVSGRHPSAAAGGTLAGKVGGLGRRQSREFPSPLHLDLVGVTEETTSVPEPSVLREGPRACLASHPARGPWGGAVPLPLPEFPRGAVWANARPMTTGPGSASREWGEGQRTKVHPAPRGPHVRATYETQGWPAFWGDFILHLSGWLFQPPLGI